MMENKGIRKLLLVMFLSTLLSFAMYGMDSKYLGSDYQATRSRVNGAVQEYAISSYGDNKVIYLKATNKKTEVYEGTLDPATGDIKTVLRNKILSTLGIEGTVAYDVPGKKLYYTKTSKKGSELYVSEYKDKTWTKGKKVVMQSSPVPRGAGSFIADAGWRFKPQSKVGEVFNPSLGKSGNRIYFTSTTPEGNKGGWDIWFIEKTADGKQWSFPVNLGTAVNSTEDEDYAFVENDEILYFTRGSAGNRTVYQSKRLEEGWGVPEKLDDRFNDSSDNFNLIVMKGAPFFVSTRVAKEKENIYYLKEVKVVSIDTVPEIEPEVPIQEEIQRQREYKYVMFQFDFDKREFKEEYREDLKELIATMEDFPETTRFMITGHTDDRGSDKYNEALSLRRAQEIKAQLVEAGFDPDRLEVEGKGKRELLVKDSDTEEDHYRNRRVEVTIIMDQEE